MSCPVWVIAPIIPSRTASCGVRPKSDTAPPSGLVSPMSMSMVVVLPAPLGPSRATVEPRRSVRSSPRTARTAPKDFVSPLATMVSDVDAAGEASVTDVSRIDVDYPPKVLEHPTITFDVANDGRSTYHETGMVRG